jgi:cytidylate kinase
VAIIVLTHEVGTQVEALAEQIARELDFSVCYRDMPPASGDSAVLADERVNHRLTPAEAIDALALKRDRAGLEAMEGTLVMALRGRVVLCGSLAAHLLRDVGHALRVRVRATMALRVRRLSALLETDDIDVALAQVLQSDQQTRCALARTFAISDPEDCSLYDAVTDTGRLPLLECAQQIIGQASGERFSDRQSDTVEIERLMLRVRAALKWESRARECVQPNAPIRVEFGGASAHARRRPRFAARGGARIYLLPSTGIS